MQSSSEQEQRSDVLDRLKEAPMRRTIHPRRRLGPVNQTADTTSGTSRSETTTSTNREERRQVRSSLMWSRPIQSPWYVYKQDSLKFSLQTVRFAADTMRFAGLNGLPSNNTMGPVNARTLQDVKMNHRVQKSEERPGRFLTTKAPTGNT